ncbi:hypothetical protein MLD38_009954 [Melastoma candidum]|uniref:Uncharacterized protein n=1 Tax=Melastoma candidum TaxID=119954 RepID=A0ACB9QZK1_9MYRT|nr:hypothetical protein MLD38_009954 [Melastoma candidum]
MDSALTDIHGQLPTVSEGSVIPSQFQGLHNLLCTTIPAYATQKFPARPTFWCLVWGEASRMVLASKPMLTSLLPHQSGIDPYFQAGPSGVSDARNSNSGLGQVYVDASCSRSGQYGPYQCRVF